MRTSDRGEQEVTIYGYPRIFSPPAFGVTGEDERRDF
jgi:hypothetical protein